MYHYVEAISHTLRTWFSVRLNCHVGKEGGGTAWRKVREIVGVLTKVVSLDCGDEAAQISCKSGCGKPVCGEGIMKEP